MATFNEACEQALRKSVQPDNKGCTFHVCAIIEWFNTGNDARLSWYVSDWFNADTARAKAVDGQLSKW